MQQPRHTTQGTNGYDRKAKAGQRMRKGTKGHDQADRQLGFQKGPPGRKPRYVCMACLQQQRERERKREIERERETDYHFNQ